MVYKYFPFAGILIILLSSCAAKTDNNKSAKSNAVGFIEGVVARPTLLEQSILVSGTLKPYEETVLMPDIAGRVVAINFQEGMFIKKGTPLIQLFNDDLVAQLHKLQAQIKLIEENGKAAKRADTAVSGISKQEYDQTVLQMYSVKADIEVVQADLRKTEVLAPFDGVIGLRNISVGAVVMPATPLATIRQLHQLKLEFSFPGKYTSEVRKGTRI